jgi:hypothetical protein
MGTDFRALPVLIDQTLDSGWFRFLFITGTVAVALSGVVCAHAGQYTVERGGNPFERIPAVRRRLDGGVLHRRPDQLAAGRNGADEQRALPERWHRAPP